MRSATCLALTGALAACASPQPAPPTHPGAASPAPAAGPPAASPPAQPPPPAAAATPLPAAKPTRWWQDAVFYEVFVRSFKDADGDGIGDLDGLTSKLDYLNDGDPSTDTDLGVNALWLMPINASPSYHGYDVTDYRAVKPQYGTLADFDRLIREAHRRGIKVVMDLVMNHTSTAHPWFKASRDPASPYRDYYTWTQTPDRRRTRPWDGAQLWHAGRRGDYYYALFWSGMPDLNLGNPKVQDALLDAMRFWLKRGVDGFRVDAARYLFEDGSAVADVAQTHAFIKQLHATLRAEFPQAVLIAEAWADADTVAEYYGDGDEFDLGFSFDLSGVIQEAAKDGLRAVLRQKLKTALDAHKSLSFIAPFISNHDMARAMRGFKDEPTAKIAAALLFSLPGTPFVYYGEELGMRGGPSRADEDKRTPMRWSEGPRYGFTTAKKAWHEAGEPPGVSVQAQKSRPDSLLSTYRSLIRLRRTQPALARGLLSQPALQGGGRGAVAWLREVQGQRLLFVANLHRQPAEPLWVDVQGVPRLLYGQGQGSFAIDRGRLYLPAMGAQSFAFIRLDWVYLGRPG